VPEKPADSTRPDGATREAEEQEARAAHQADRPPTDQEDEAAPGREDLDPGVAEHHQEMTERGAGVEGEGQLP